MDFPVKKAILAAVWGVLCVVMVSWKDSGPGEARGSGKDAAGSAGATLITADEAVYQSLGLHALGLQKEVFARALAGYRQLESQGALDKPLLAIVDFSQPSARKRLYIVDMANKKLLVNSLVAHGRNSGDVMATRFSNTPSSLQSSLGFYITGDTYIGSNGLSMRLKGQEPGFNDRALARAIVMHGAPYVNESMAAGGRIGRSWGCPAVSQKEHKQIIDLLKHGSCLFVYAPNAKYMAASSLARPQG